MKEMSIKFRLDGELYMIINLLTYAWFVNAHKNGKLIEGVLYDAKGNRVYDSNDGIIVVR